MPGVAVWVDRAHAELGAAGLFGSVFAGEQRQSLVPVALACCRALGLPLSHFISDRWGWQSSFYVLSAITFALFLTSLAILPKRDAATQDAAAQDVRTLRTPRLWARYLASLLTIGAAYASFSFFTPLLEDNAGFSTNATTIILLLYGVCAYIGNVIVGRFADRHAIAVLRIGHSLLLVSLVLLAALNHIQPLTLAMVIIVGCVGVTMNPALVTRVAEVGGAGTMVSTIHTAVISAGVTLGSAVSSATMGTLGNDDPGVAMWTGAVLAILAAIALATQSRSSSKASAVPASPPSR